MTASTRKAWAEAHQPLLLFGSVIQLDRNKSSERSDAVAVVKSNTETTAVQQQQSLRDVSVPGLFSVQYQKMTTFGDKYLDVCARNARVIKGFALNTLNDFPSKFYR